MRSTKENIETIKDYIAIAFESDEEIVELYDKNVEVEDVQDVIDSVIRKIESVEGEVDLVGVSVEYKKVGYIIFAPKNLVSFGLNKKYRNSEFLPLFWEQIKSNLGGQFECSLFGHNERAIKWLERAGMKIIFKNVTTLELCQ